MIKNIVLFIFSTIIGLGLYFGYINFFSNNKNILNNIISPVSKFSLANAPTDALQGTIASMSGTVVWQSRTANQPIKIKQNQIIQQGEGITTGKDGNATVEFANEIIQLFPNTTLNIIQTIPADIVMEQSSGNTTYTKMGTTPVSIRNFDLLTTINQGAVNISMNKDKQTVTILMQNGTATEAFNDLENVSHVMQLKTGDTFVFNNNTKKGNILP